MRGKSKRKKNVVRTRRKGYARSNKKRNALRIMQRCIRRKKRLKS